MSTKPREDFNNKKLVCSAHHGGKDFKKRVKASVTLKIECKYTGVYSKFSSIRYFGITLNRLIIFSVITTSCLFGLNYFSAKKDYYVKVP